MTRPKGAQADLLRAQAPAISGASSLNALAASIARPTYRRLLAAEPFLRRAVPVLVVAFVATLLLGGIVLMLDSRQEAIQNDKLVLTAINEVVANKLSDQSHVSANGASQAAQTALSQLNSQNGLQVGQVILVTDPAKVILAIAPSVLGPFAGGDGSSISSGSLIGRPLSDLLPKLGVSKSSSEGETQFNHSDAIIAIRELGLPFGRVISLWPENSALTSWRREVSLTTALMLTTSFVVIVLGFAFHWQASRAREADRISDSVQNRISAAFAIARCGLWDLDLSEGKIFWSESMFNLLGLSYTRNFLVFSDIDALVHPADADIGALISQIVDKQSTSIDQFIRMRHQRKGWIQIRLRLSLITEPSNNSIHFLGMAVEQDAPGVSAAHSQSRLDVYKPPHDVLPEHFLSSRRESREKKVGYDSGYYEGISISRNQGVAISRGVPYSSLLVRIFTIACIASGFGLALLIWGLVAGSFDLQLTGAGLLALGMSGAALAVLAGQGAGERDSDAQRI